jgi:hypothetical protein
MSGPAMFSVVRFAGNMAELGGNVRFIRGLTERNDKAGLRGGGRSHSRTALWRVSGKITGKMGELAVDSC